MVSAQNDSMPNLALTQFGIGTFSAELVLSNLVRWLITLPGLLFNAALFYTIIFEKNLRGTCSTLLAIGSVVDFCFLLTYSIPFAISLVGQNLISNSSCYVLQFLPNIGLFSSVWIVFFVGVDRLISVLMPLRYNLLEDHLFIYMLPMLTVTFGYSFYVLAEAAHWTLFVYPNWPVLCNNVDMFNFGMSKMLLRNGLVINAVSLICYALVGLALFRCCQKNPSAVLKHRIFKSLAAIMSLVVGSYFAICVIRLLPEMQTQFYILHIAPTVAALLTVTAASSNAPVLLAFSTEYRQAFHKHLREWPLLGKCLLRMEQRTNVSAVTNFNNAIQPSSVSRFGQVTTVKGGVPGSTTVSSSMRMATVDA